MIVPRVQALKATLHYVKLLMLKTSIAVSLHQSKTTDVNVRYFTKGGVHTPSLREIEVTMLF